MGMASILREGSLGARSIDSDDQGGGLNIELNWLELSCIGGGLSSMGISGHGSKLKCSCAFCQSDFVRGRAKGGPHSSRLLSPTITSRARGLAEVVKDGLR